MTEGIPDKGQTTKMLGIHFKHRHLFNWFNKNNTISSGPVVLI